MNPHGFPHTPLKRTRLPVPPPARNSYLPLDCPTGAGSGCCCCCGAGIGRTLAVTLVIPARFASKVRNNEVKAKVPAKIAVNFFMKSDPVGVLMRESPPPPNTDKPAPRPVCKRTTRIMSRHTMT